MDPGCRELTACDEQAGMLADVVKHLLEGNFSDESMDFYDGHD